MVSASFPNRPFNLRDEVWLITQDYGNNRSLLGWRLWVDKRSYSPTFSNGAANRWMRIAGQMVHSYGGNGFDFRSGNNFVLAEGQLWVGHDGNGFCSFDIEAGADFDILGSTYLRYNGYNLPRIPKTPAPPNIYEAVDYTAVSFGIRYTRGDNMGAGIEQDHAQWSRTPDFSQVVWDDYGPNGYTNPRGNGDGPGPLLDSNTQYWVRVRSRNSMGWGGWSNTGSAITYGHPGAPTGLTATASSSVAGRMALAWSAPSVQGTGGITGYNIFRNGTQIATTTGTGTTFTDNGLVPFATYEYKVSARSQYSQNVGGTGPQSAAVSALAQGAPTATRNLTAVSDSNSPGVIQLSWDAPATSGLGGITGYRIYRSEGALVGSVSGSTRNFTVSGLTPGSEYTFRVAAINPLAELANILGGFSNYASVTPIGEPKAPGNMTVVPAANIAGRLNLSWSAPTGSLSGYNVFQRVNGVDRKIAALGVGFTSYSVDDLTPGQSYTFSVRARTVYTDTLETDGYPGNWGGPASAAVSGTPSLNSTQSVPNVTATTSSTNVAFAGTYIINAVTPNSIGYARTAADIPRVASGGSITNNTNVVFNGTYTISTPSATSISYTKASANISPVGATGTLTNPTNASFNGTFTVSTVNAGANLVSYSKSGSNVASTSVPINAAPGQSSKLTNLSNAVFNGTGKTITAVTATTISYAQNNANVAEGNAAGTVTNATNRDIFNGLYTVSAIPDYNIVKYARSKSDVPLRTWDEPNGEVFRTVSPALLDVRYRSGWAG